MAEGAKVENIDAIADFRRKLAKFCETAVAALADAEGEVQRTMVWLQVEQRSYWQHQLRIRTENVTRAKEALRWKKLYKDPSGARQSYIDEERALMSAERKLTEAEQKIRAVHHYTNKLEKELHAFKGSVQRFESDVTIEMPVASDKLAGLIAQLERYVAARPTVVASEAPSEAGASATASMSRGEAESVAREGEAGEAPPEPSPDEDQPRDGSDGASPASPSRNARFRS
jgi:hypothetical protein